MTLLPPFTEVARRRPVALVQPGTAMTGAPYAAASGPAPELRSDAVTLRAVHQGPRVVLEVSRPGRTERHSSVRHGWTRSPDELAVTLTGPVVTAWSAEAGVWTARAQTRFDVRRWSPGTRPGLHPGDGVSAAGGFGQLGLRDLRLVTHADGSPYAEGPAGSGPVLLTATSAGPGGFRTGHTSVWALDPGDLTLTHRADLFFRRSRLGPVLGHHATHLVRDGGAWLVATSSWGSFDPDRRPGVEVLLGRTLADVTRGRHVLGVAPLDLPLAGLGSVGAWDPQLVHDGERWLVAFVSARRFFSFHPGVATGVRLDDLSLLGAATDRVSCEGPTLVRLGDRWRLVASDGREEQATRRAGYPSFDLTATGLRETGRLDATYPTNLPWPTLLPHDDGWLMIGFDGTPYGGALVGYGSHGDVVLQRT